jgi:hypothetical protein
MASHASYPCAERQVNGLYKIYFSTRNSENRSAVGYVIIDLENPQRIIGISAEPVLSPGAPGTFDGDGVSMGCLCEANGKKFLYYLGWRRQTDVPWRNTIGLAVYDPSTGAFQKHGRNPVLELNETDPHTLTYPFVLFDEGQYKMWYGSGLSWGARAEDTLHLIKYAVSPDGMAWTRDGTVCFRPEGRERYAAVKPCVLKENGRYKMWYTWRDAGLNLPHRIGYAESADGIHWTQQDERAGLGVSAEGWDREMVCYPFVFDAGDRRYMLYNGNGYGKTGFGIAELE